MTPLSFSGLAEDLHTVLDSAPTHMEPAAAKVSPMEPFVAVCQATALTRWVACVHQTPQEMTATFQKMYQEAQVCCCDYTRRARS